ncbi:MAG: LysM peptidoglycan-binding domain-containing protein [Clostridia bacterium]|nr:LysM peptidoglycan-binding domain-containing protein [Clostridia bacterium]
MKRIIICMLALVLAFGTGFVLPDSDTDVYAAKSAYVHNPALNVNVMQDVIADPSAVYGFRPDPASERLGAFADESWSDPVKVEQWKQERIAYHNDFVLMYDAWKSMESEGKSIEEIARRVSGMRNEIRLAAYDNNPEGLARVKESNLQKYGNENGPTAESLFEKYGSWQKVLLKAFSENPGMDACLGLYDDYYDNYSKVGALNEQKVQKYTVKKGDYLRKIAAKYYGDRSSWRKIYNENKSAIKNPNLIYPGQVLNIRIA